MKELHMTQVEHVNGGSVAMTLATGWAGTVSGAAVGAVIGGLVGVFVGAAAGFIVGVGSGIAYSLSTKQTVVIATCDVLLSTISVRLESYAI